ncbi:MAG: molybdenum cofactor biosynthesis protein MoeB [Candidatus Fluviicola riflensis]|nr:MAG: molybdenum cofactor biosynthesis protein MoeB [Candidatus Fluviicola riflensis]OGS77398.1 MAG: molybdenum cofactor biosynthesis protein MoeB [Candidatus Fluviicola riflensis]OGS83978.1 MAG: molybdenum cofactor biosynthesis protein MoeB [Fluviicola sp. RIFCSPHIGHO2_12_FULL_43_24]OGS84465.1 MAG: molybdenum cofactor biosynthesis protein MoeB [Fluviicola sp. RIFCSPHIGHO2_01_FULL_43_53]
MLSASEKKRYQRQIHLEGFGEVSQEKLLNARVLVIGAGALGCPALTYLAVAGVGTLGIVDNDAVELSNLHRQSLYTTDDCGKPKVHVAKERLSAMNPEIIINTYQTYLSPENVMELISGYDVIVDGTDNFQARYLINDACVLAGKPNVHGSVVRFSGTLSVFNYHDSHGNTGPNYRDLFPVPPTPEEAPSCAEAGVIGVIPAIIGSMQAMETIKLITGVGEVASGKFLQLNALSNSQQTLYFDKDPLNPLNNASENFIFETDYATFCHQKKQLMKSITVTELKALKDQGANFQLIDVRETYEHDICDIGGELIPMNEVPNSVDKISKDKQVVVHCRSGKRSGNVINFLEDNYGFTNLYNLEGGILAWAGQIDPTMEQY